MDFDEDDSGDYGSVHDSGAAYLEDEAGSLITPGARFVLKISHLKAQPGAQGVVVNVDHDSHLNDNVEVQLDTFADTVWVSWNAVSIQF